jgi:hypothetical protein
MSIFRGEALEWDIPKGKSLTSNTEIINIILDGLNRDFTFYILGGSQLDIHLGKEINLFTDIDLFFPNKEEYLKLKGALINRNYPIIKESDFADTFNIDNFDVQLVKFNFGTPDKICNNFDLNKSRIGVIIQGESITEYQHRTFKENLYIDYSNFKNATPNRFMKYILKLYDSVLVNIKDIKHKYYLDHKMFEIIKFLLENKDKEFLDYYSREGKISGYKILKLFAAKILRYEGHVVVREIIRDVILRDFSNLPIRKQIEFWNFIGEYNTTEKLFQKDIILMGYKNIKNDMISQEFKSKYPQFFI